MATETEHTLIRLTGESALLQAKLLRTARALVLVEQQRAHLVEKTPRGALGAEDVSENVNQLRDNATTAARIAALAAQLRPTAGPPDAEVIELADRRHADDRLSGVRDSRFPVSDTPGL